MADWSPSEVPTGDVEVPDEVRLVAAGRSLRPVWRNDLGGLTFEVGSGTDRMFVKWSPPGGPELDDEVERLAWAAAFTAVPRVVDRGRGWFASTPLPGRSAVDPRWLREPDAAARAIGQGLRRLHDSLPVDRCPFRWSAADRVAGVDRLDPSSWRPEHRHLSVAEATALVGNPPAVDRLVVCHGDACAPNTLVADDGSVAGHVDLGSLGTADRWADLAVATWSTVWNYGPGYEETLLEAYGITPDPERTAYYRLLWDLTS